MLCRFRGFCLPHFSKYDIKFFVCTLIDPHLWRAVLNVEAVYKLRSFTSFPLQDDSLWERIPSSINSYGTKLLLAISTSVGDAVRNVSVDVRNGKYIAGLQRWLPCIFPWVSTDDAILKAETCSCLVIYVAVEWHIR